MTYKEYLTTHGIQEETAEKLGLSFDGEKNRIIIPIKDAKGHILFNKYRNLEHDNNPAVPKFNYDPGSSARLYNLQAVNGSKYVFIFEGEPDIWKAVEDKIPAVCGTSGAGTFEEEWAEQLSNKKIFVCYDSDEAGQKGLEKLKELLPLAIFITLPENTKDYCEYRKQHSVADFQTLIKQQQTEQTADFTQLCDVLDKWLLLPDKHAIKILLATIISHAFTTDPLWLFLVAPPSGTKTELISALSSLPKVFPLSDLTPQTLASGLNYKTDPSLLARLKDNIVTMKDFTTVLSMRFEERQVILSQLREIYDGKYHKEFGSGKTVDWTGKITLIAGVTPIIDTQLAIFQVMGERFIMYRVPQATDTDVAEKALGNYGQEKEMRQELSAVVLKFFRKITITPANEIELPSDILKALAMLASFIVILRSGVIRNNYTKEIEFIPTPEAPARFAKQLGVLLKALAMLDNRKNITWEDFYLILKTALDGIARNLIVHLVAVCKFDSARTAEIAEDTKYSVSGAEVILGDLSALNLIDCKGEGMGVTKYWSLSEKTKKYFRNILPNKDKKVWEIFPKDNIYYPIIKTIFNENDENDEKNFVNDLINEKTEK